MTEQTKIVIADDHPIFRAGLRQVVESDPRFTVVGEASDGAAALQMIADLVPDIVITDINMPGLNGFEIAGEMRRRGLPGEIVLLTIHDEEAMFVRAMSLGVRGYVVKEGATADIVNCLHAVRRGQSFTSAAVTGYLFNRANGNARPVEGLGSLTAAERKVLRLIADHKTSREIAAELGISARTVDNHRNNISAKLNLRGSHALVKFALQNLGEI